MINQITNLDRVKNENIVFIADRVFKGSNEINENDDTLEMISDEYYYQVFDCLNSITRSVTHYNALENFIDNISKHKKDIVFTIYGGKSSRNRMALVPAICEAYKIRFVGADTYARIVCQDKQIAKEHCKRIGLYTPPHLLVDRFSDLELIQDIELPVVIKPNMEGSSIGIHENSLVANYKDAIVLSKEILNKYKQSVLVEQFVSGKEVCVCVSGTQNVVKLIEVVEVYMTADERYFYEKLYTASIKHVSDTKTKRRIITKEVEQSNIEKLIKVFLSLGKMDYLRIDGKVIDGKFSLIELTPDPHLGSSYSFTEAFKKNGKSYEEMISTLICNALDYYQHPYSNM